jgi:hypothetical protein
MRNINYELVKIIKGKPEIIIHTDKELVKLKSIKENFKNARNGAIYRIRPQIIKSVLTNRE